MHGGQLAAKALKAAGVECVFTLSGGHIMPIYDGCLDEGIQVVDVRHEQAAVHAADAWARLHPGKVGVAIVTAGPGVTDGVTGVANAWRANSPILVFGGQGPFDNLRRGSLQEMDHVSLMRPITKWADACYQTHRIGEYVELAVRTALSGVPGPAFLEIPMDVLSGQWTRRRRYVPPFRTTGWPHAAPADVGEAAVELLARRPHPMVMAGTSLKWSEGGGGAAALRRGDAHPLLHQRHGPGHPAHGPSAVLQPHRAAGAGPGRRRRAGRHAARLPHEVRPLHPGRAPRSSSSTWTRR